MKKLYLTVLFIISLHALFAQKTLSVEYGALFKNEKREIPIDIVGQDDTGYYLLYSEGKYGQGDDMFLRKFNLDLTPTGQEINLKNEVYEGDFNSLGLTKINDNIIHVFYVLTDTGKKYYYQSVDLKSFTLGQTTFITQIDNDTKKASNSLSRFIISEDENTITLFYTIPNKNKEAVKITVQTFDTHFKEIAKASYEFPFNNNVLYFNSIFTNAKQELYALCKVYDDSKILNNENHNRYAFKLFKIAPQNLELIATIRPKDVHLRRLNTTLINDDELVFTGLYSKKNLYAMSGVFSAKVNLNTKTLEYNKYHDFTADFYGELLEDGKKKDKELSKFNDGKREDPNYILKQTIKLDQDNLLVMAEQTWSFTYNYVTTYYHHNLAMIKLDPNGNVLWTHKIGKRNDKVNVSIYNSYFPVVKDQDLYLFYNGNSKNLYHKTGFIANSFGSADGVFMCTKVSPDGHYKRQVLSTKQELEGVTIRPRLYNWMDENTLLMFGQDIDNLKNQRFIKVLFK